jgi:hypothetical protein
MDRLQHANAAIVGALSALVCLFFVASVGGCATNTSVEEAIGGGPPPQGEVAPHTLRFETWSGGNTQIDLYDFRQALTDMGVYQRWGVDAEEGLTGAEFASGVLGIWDTDGDGTVSRDEWQAAKDQWYIKGLEAGSFDSWARDDKAAIGPREFASALLQTRLYWSWDDDQNGTLDRREFAEEVFRIWDTSDDGAIQKSEWQQATDQWIETSVRRGVSLSEIT